MPKAATKKVAKRVAKPYDIIPPDSIQIVSYSELDTFRQCPLKHHLLYQRRWTKPTKPGSALDKGSLYHLVMEAHYRVIKEVQDAHRGRVPKKLVAETLKRARDEVMAYLVHPTTGEQSEVQELIEWMYDGYVEYYGVDEDWRVVGVEHQIIQPLPDAYGNPSRYHLKMKIDLLVREWSTGNLWVIDHKSGANLPSKMDLEIDDQFGLYTWGMRSIGRKVQGSLHNANRTQRNKSFMPLDTRMSRTYLNRMDKELDNLALDAYYAARAAYPDDPSYAARYSAPDPRSCGWKCDVKEPHLLMRTGRNPDEVMVEYGFTVNRTRH
jgi:predicted acetyltransferase